MNIDAIQAHIWQVLAEQTATQPIPPVADAPLSCVCPVCCGLGYITLDLPYTHEMFGRAFHCICQRQEILRKRIASALSDSGAMIPNEAYSFDFDDFSRLKHASYALPLARQLAEYGAVTHEGKTKPGLYLMGGTGTGKTTLSVCILRWRVGAGDSVLWTDCIDLVKRVQASYNDKYEGVPESVIIDTVSQVTFLVLDDLGTLTSDKLASESKIEIFFRIINFRYANKLPTVISSNLPPAKLAKQFGDRIESRILGLCHVVEMAGKDLRV